MNEYKHLIFMFFIYYVTIYTHTHNERTERRVSMSCLSLTSRFCTNIKSDTAEYDEYIRSVDSQVLLFLFGFLCSFLIHICSFMFVCFR